MVKVWSFILLSIVTYCWSQTPTHYTMQAPKYTVFERAGAVQVCISRTGDDINVDGTAFLTTEDISANGGEDFAPLDEYSFEFEPNVKEQCLDIAITDDDDPEYTEIFKVIIVSASDGIPGSQPSSEITIEQNDHCTEIALSSVDPVYPFYVSPWNPESGKAIIYKNTLGIQAGLTFYLTSSSEPAGDYMYEIQIEWPNNAGLTDILVHKNGNTHLLAESEADILQSVDGETVAIEFDQSTGTFTITYSNSPSASIEARDTFGGAPIPVHHIFAAVTTGSETFTLCNADPIELPQNAADQSGTSQTYPDAEASLAIDGTRNSDLTEGSEICSVTGNVPDPWWRVDLGDEYHVSAVGIYPITDDDASNLDDISDAQVYVGSCNETFIEHLKLCGIASNSIPSEGDEAPFDGTRFPNYVECSSSYTYGRYVYIRLDTDIGVMDTLALCEVEVYGTKVPLGSETTVAFSTSSYIIAEANTSVPVIVEASGPGASCTAVDIYTEDDTATSDGITQDQMDFTAIPQATPRTLTFDPTTTTHIVNVAINDDDVCEKEESFKLTLSNVEEGVLGTVSETTVGIRDDDGTQYSIEDASDGFEIQEGEGPLEISIIRIGSERVLLAEGSVLFTSEEEGNAIGQTVEFESDETEEEVSIEPIDDNVFEEDTTFTIRLQAIDECDTLVADENVAIVSVKDDDSRFCFDDDNLDDDTITIPEDAGSYRIKLTREGTARDKTVDVSVQRSADEHDNAESGEDFTLSIASVTFKSDEDEAYISLTIENDYYKEGDESFDLLLSDPNGIADNIKEPYRITVVIEDDDAIYRFQPYFYSVSESSQSVNVCLYRSGALTTTTIELETHDVTTTAGKDYVIPSGGIEVTFFAGLSEACASISILGDAIAEQTETFLVFIASEHVQKELDTQATVSIHDDPDVFISFSSDEYVVNEAEGTVTVYVNKVGDISQSISVSITSSSLTADSDDYVSTAGLIRIPPGQSTASYDVIINNDNLDEGKEEFRLTLSNPFGGVISHATTTVTIQDDDSDHLQPDDPINVLSGGLLAGIIVGAVVVTLAIALGVALFCAYLLRRAPPPVVISKTQLPFGRYPGEFGNGNGRGLPYGQPFYSGQKPNVYFS